MADTVQYEYIKLVGENKKVPIRSAPTQDGEIIDYLFSESVVQVKVTNSKGFYRMADGVVSNIYVHTRLYLF